MERKKRSHSERKKLAPVPKKKVEKWKCKWNTQINRHANYEKGSHVEEEAPLHARHDDGEDEEVGGRAWNGCLFHGVRATRAQPMTVFRRAKGASFLDGHLSSSPLS